MAIKKEVLELASFKCLCEAPLTAGEAVQIAEASMEDLLEIGHTISEVKSIVAWFRLESQRLITQSQLDISMIAESAKHTIGSKRLREIIAEEVVGFTKGK